MLDDHPDLDFLTGIIFSEALHERARQKEKWGDPDHPDGDARSADMGARLEAEARSRLDDGDQPSCSWSDILAEEVGEALQADGEHLERELVQVIAVCVAWLLARRKRVRADNRAVRWLRAYAKGEPAAAGFAAVVSEQIARSLGWVNSAGVTRAGQMILALTMRVVEPVAEPEPPPARAGQVIELAQHQRRTS